MTNPKQREKIARDALLPCPFCGGEPNRYTANDCPGFANRQVQCGRCGASAFDIKWQVRIALAAILALDPAPESAIPAGMVAWVGGDSAPADWDGGPVMLRDGRIWNETPYWRHRPNYGDGQSDLVAYTPRPAPESATPKRIDFKALWIKHGGRQHGPHVEQYYIEQQAFYRFAADLATLARSSGS